MKSIYVLKLAASLKKSTRQLSLKFVISLGLCMFSAFGARATQVDQKLVGALASESPEERQWVQSVLPLVIRVDRAAGFVIGQLSDGRHLLGSASHVVYTNGRMESFYEYSLLDNTGWRAIANAKFTKFSSADLVYMPMWEGPEDPNDSFLSISSHEDYTFAVLGDSDFFPPQLFAARSSYIGKWQAGEEALLIGFPEENDSEQSYSIGSVLTDEQAIELTKNDLDEAELFHKAFDPKVSFIVLAKATPGMSGGPVFNRSGEIIGVAVAAGRTKDGKEFFTAVKLEWAIENTKRRARVISQEDPYTDGGPTLRLLESF